MVLDDRRHSRLEADAVLVSLADWEEAAAYLTTLHPGDVGWAMRQPDDAFALHSWWDDGVLVAVVLVEGDAARCRLSPAHSRDRALAEAVAETCDGVTWYDAQPGTRLRVELGARGWQPDPAPWVTLYTDLAPGSPMPALVAPTRPDDVADRVGVQRRGFAGSTFTVEAWHRMAASPAFDPRLDLLARDESGAPVSAGTAWHAGPGRCGILEPVATDPDHRGHGHGRRVVHGLKAALAEVGAGGVAVCTPASNRAALALYRAAGFHPVELVHALHRPTAT